MNTNQLTCSGVILCEKTTIDKDSNLLSLANIVFQFFLNVTPEELASVEKQPKLTNKPLELVIFWNRDNDLQTDVNMEFTVDFVGPTGKTLMSNIKSFVEMRNGSRKFYSIIKLPQGVLCQESGLHTFRVMSKDIEKTGVALVHEEGLTIHIDTHSAQQGSVSETN